MSKRYGTCKYFKRIARREVKFLESLLPKPPKKTKKARKK